MSIKRSLSDKQRLIFKLIGGPKRSALMFLVMPAFFCGLGPSCASKSLRAGEPGLKWGQIVINPAVHGPERMTTQPTFADANSASWNWSSSEKLELRRRGPISELESRSLMTDRIAYMRALLQTHVDPYWGTPDPGAGRCQLDQFKSLPIVETSAALFIQFVVGATAEFVVGTCVDKDEINVAKTQLIYCKSTQLFYELKYFYKKSDPHEPKPQDYTLASCD